MEVENRDWGRPNPVDFVPVLGMAYRLYWMLTAWRGLRSAGGDWSVALRLERYRFALAVLVTAGLGLFLALGADRAAAKPALLLVLIGLFMHKAAAAFGLGAADGP